MKPGNPPCIGRPRAAWRSVSAPVQWENQRGVSVVSALSRGKLLECFAKLPPTIIGMEACSGAHHWARALGHDARISAMQLWIQRTDRPCLATMPLPFS